MKKLIIAAMALTCATAIVSADTVTSENIVGYNKAAVKGGVQILGTQFDTGDNSPTGVFGSSLPFGSKIWVYDGAYAFSVFEEDFLGNKAWSKPLDLGQSIGYWVELPAGEGTYTNIISGDVYLADAVTNAITDGVQLLSYPYPVERTVSQLGFTPSVGDKVWVYKGGYEFAVFEEDFLGVKAWSKPNLLIGVGEGFWYETTVNTNWIVTRPF